MAGLLALAIALLAQPAFGHSSSQQAGRPQPPPDSKTAVTPQAGETAKSGAPQAAGTTAAGGQTTKPKPADPQATGAKKPAPKAPAPKKKGPPQTSRVWKGRGFAVASGGLQPWGPGYTSTVTFKVHAEDATLKAKASIHVGPAFGARGGLRVWRNMALGGGFAVAPTGQTLNVTGSLPHPFMFDRNREVQGTASGLDRFETLVAFEASWLTALSRRVDMFVFGGPAYVHVRQDMATKIQFKESYPYDTATYTGVETTSVSGGAFGITAGADVSYLLTRTIGVGGEVRYSYASATLSPAGQPSKVGLGGVQVNFCVRLLF